MVFHDLETYVSTMYLWIEVLRKILLDGHLSKARWIFMSQPPVGKYFRCEFHLQHLNTI